MTTARTISGNPRRLREYETIYILQSSVDPDEADRIATRMKDIVSQRSGHLVKIDNWGKRKLAYPIHKASRGVFVFMKYLGFEDMVAEIERNLRLLDPVVRYQTVLMNGDVKLEAYQVDPADLEFRRLEASTEADEEPSVAQRLGLLDAPRPMRHEGGYGDEAMEDEYGGGAASVDDSGYGGGGGGGVAGGSGGDVAGSSGGDVAGSSGGGGVAEAGEEERS